MKACAIAQVIMYRLSTAAAQAQDWCKSSMGSVLDRAASDRFSLSTMVSLPIIHSTNCSTIIIIIIIYQPRLVQYAKNGLSTSGLGSTPAKKNSIWNSLQVLIIKLATVQNLDDIMEKFSQNIFQCKFYTELHH
jgi:hypothetical protein